MPREQPQVRIITGGVLLAGAISTEVISVGYFAADRFRVELAIGAGPKTTVDFLAALTAVTVTIEVALGLDGFVTLLTGQIDNVRFDLPRGVATLCGRDLSARLIDAEVSETFVNQTSSQIAETIAGRHGLAPNVTATTTTVGQYYELDHARFGLGLNARGTTEWNLLVWLAQLEGFALSVTGETLNFKPAMRGTPVWVSARDMMSLCLDVAMTVPTRAVVKSWNTRNKVVVTQMAGAAGGNVTTLIRPNMTMAEARVMAGNHLADLAAHGTILEAEMPGELTLAVDAEIVLAGTGSAFDQVYLIDVISRSIDAQRGFVQSLRGHALVS